MTSPLPAPGLIGLPPKFASWRPGQAEAVCRALDTDKRFSVLGMPTGFGKSLVYLAAGVLDEPTVFLTSTKGLQSQLIADFSESGLVDVRGMGNYECVRQTEKGHPAACDEGPCLAGVRCDFRDAGCLYFDAQRTARASALTVTNYAYWLAANSQDGEAPLGPRGRLVLDEAHAALDELGQHLAVTVGYDEIQQHLGGTFPDSNIIERWQAWARIKRVEAQSKLESLGGLIKIGLANTRTRLSQYRALRELNRRLSSLAELKGDWIVEDSRDRRGRRSWRFDPVWPGSYAESSLFLQTPKVILTSATIRPKSLELLGIKESDYEFQEYPSNFPVNNRLVYAVPCVRVKHGMDATAQRLWVAKIDAILRSRGDRKGIIHTVSYARRDYLLRYSEFRERMCTHESGGLAEAVRVFREARPGAVFVSPSVSTGFDFPGTDCRYQIIGKIPFPDTRSRVLQARAKQDPDYFAYMAMQTLVQTCGRGVRSATDWCENFIVDDNVGWFMAKYKSFAPRWFLESFRRVNMVPVARPLTP